MVVPLLPSPLSGTINKPQRKMATRQKMVRKKWPHSHIGQEARLSVTIPYGFVWCHD